MEQMCDGSTTSRTSTPLARKKKAKIYVSLEQVWRGQYGKKEAEI